MKAKKLPTQAQIKEILHYDTETGVFRWRFARSNVKPWSVAGCKKDSGYIDIKLNKNTYKAHRLAWVYMIGASPLNVIDHINGNKSDNKWSNLRETTNKQNLENQTLKKDNTSGFRGVSWSKKHNKWRAYVMNNYKYIHVGIFITPEEAAKAAATKRNELFTHDTGRDNSAKNFFIDLE